MTSEFSEQINFLSQQIKEADAIVIGGGSGLSSSAGYNHYHWDNYFTEKLQKFIDYYGFTSPFAGFYHVFSDYESQWGYYAAYIQAMWDAPTGQVYQNLADLLKKKNAFVLTTNIDMQFRRVFPENSICHFQGDFGYLQCSQPCHDMIYPDKELIREMAKNLDAKLRIPSELVPRCKECGRVMVPWVRDDTFLQGTEWKKEFGRYRYFVTQNISIGKRILLLELGVGDMTPSIIKLPFWELTHRQENVFYARINQSTESVPQHIKDHALNIQADIDTAISALIERKLQD